MTSFRAAAGELAMLRLTLSKIESQHFKLAPQIPLEILLILSANRGSLRLSDLYKNVRATPAAVRLHLNSLKSSELVGEGVDPVDRRARRVFLTQKGQTDINRYADESTRVISGLCPALGVRRRTVGG
jgi:DNA-binding MarR family transcriptional regulator